jgi:hypothetical protein
MTMNARPDHLDDEILSALLDGAAESDHGAAPGAHLGSCGSCAARQDELRAARTAVAAAPVEPLDDLARRRLVAAALQAADSGAALPAGNALRPGGRARWLQRHPTLIGAVAAVLVGLLVGVPFVIGDGGDSERTLSAQAPADLRDESAGPFVGDLGDLGDRQNVRLRLSGRESATDTFAYAPAEPGPSPAAGGASGGAPLSAPTPSGGGLAGSGARSSAPPEVTAGAAEKAQADSATDAARNTEGFSSGQDDGGRDRADAAACVATLLDGAARGGRLLRSGVGTYQGRPSVVASFDLEGGTVAFVTARSGCAVLDRFPV